MFAERPRAGQDGGKKPTPRRRSAEPPKPAAPALGPPRLVKTVTRPVQPAPADDGSTATPYDTAASTSRARAAGGRGREPTGAEPSSVGRAASSQPPARRRLSPSSGTADVRSEVADRVAARTRRSRRRRAGRARRRRSLPRRQSPTAPQRPAPPAGRFVPPTLRLRIEEPGRPPQPARPLAPAKRPTGVTAAHRRSRPRHRVRRRVQRPPARPARPGRGAARHGRGRRDVRPPRPTTPAHARRSAAAAVAAGAHAARRARRAWRAAGHAAASRRHVVAVTSRRQRPGGRAASVRSAP